MEENKTELVISIEAEPNEAFYSIYAGLKLFIEHKDYVRKIKGKDELFISQLEAQSILYDLEHQNPELSEQSEKWFNQELSRTAISETEEKKYTVDEIREYIQGQDSLGDALYNLNKLK